MLIEEVVQAVREGVHQTFEPGRARAVFGAERVRIDEQPLPQVREQRGLALGFGHSSKRVQVVGLDPVEIVLGLRVLHAEDGVRIGLAEDVRDAPVVADDRDVLGVALPAGEIALLGWRGGHDTQGTTDE